MSFFYVGRRRAGKSRAFVNVFVALALLISFVSVAVAVRTTPASAAGPVPRLVKLLGWNSYQDYNDSENRLDFVIAVPTGQTPTQVRTDQDPTGALANTLSLVAGPSINNDYQIVSTTTIGAVDYLAISIRSDDNFNYGDSCTVHSLTFAVRVTVPAGVINFNEPVTQYPTNPMCPGTGRPVARTTWDNVWNSPDGNSQDGFGAVIPSGVLSGTKVIIDADNPNFQNAAGQADCGVTNSVYYQWVKPDGSPTLLTPSPVLVATTAHHFNVADSLQQAITAGFPTTFDFTADGPGYYRLLAWPQATSVPVGVSCVGRSWDQTQISQGWQVGSVWNNFTVTPPAPPVISAPVNGSFTNNTTPTISGTGIAGDTVTVTEGGTTLCTATVTAGGTWSCPSSALSIGLHTISAVQADSDGVDSNPSANDAFTVDTVAPLAPTITAPANGSSTNNPSPNITGTGEPAATVTVKDEGGATVCTATVLAGGTWQCTPAAAFSLGAHTVQATQTDQAGNLSPNSTTNAFTVTTPVFTQTKTADRASYIVGQPITYTVTVNNTGTGPGTATVADTVPASVGSVSVTCSATGAGTCNTAGSSGNTVSGSVNLPAATTATYTISGTVLSVGAVDNSATVTPTTATCTGQCGGGVASTPATTASGGPVFTQTKTADHPSYITGQAIVYTVTVNNTGTGPGTASVADTVPATVGSISVTCSATGAGTCNTTGSSGNSVAGSVNLPAGGSATYTISGTVTAAGAVGNSATVTPTSVGCVAQCGGGTAATPATTASANPVFTQTKTADQGSYIVGQAITYTVTVTNSGTGSGAATIADTVPATVGAVSVTCSATGAGTCNTTGSSGNTVAGSVNLPAGTTATYTVSGTVIAAGSVTNSVSVTPTTSGCTGQCGGGSTSTPPTTAASNPVFTQTKTADHASYITGQAIVYTITVSNTGAGPGTANIADTVPATVGSVSVTCSATGAGTCTTTGSSGNTVAGSVNLPAGTTATYTVSGTVTATGSVTNSVSVTPMTPGCTAQCGGGTAGTLITNAGGNPVFTQSKAADHGSYVTGQAITFTITVTNSGTGPGTANVADTVPASVGSVSVTCSATGAGTCNTVGSSGNTVAGSVNLPVGSTATYTVSGTVIAAGSVSNSVSVTPTTAGCTGQCGGGSASTPPITAVGNPVFTQTKTADQATYITGQAIVYTVTVNNAGTGPGTASVADTVPAGVGSVSVTCSATGAGTCTTTGSSGNAVSGSVNLGVGETAVYTITGVVNSSGSVTNSVSVTPTTPGCTAQCGGGTAGTPTTNAGGNPVFTQTKTADHGSYITGQAITYTVTVTNTGTGPGTANIGDTVPASVGSVSVTCSATGAGTCNTTGSAGNTVAGSVNLPVGETATYTVSGTVIAVGSVSNSVSVTPTTPGCTGQCGGGSTSTPVITAAGSPVFTQTKTADRASYITGQAITYTVTVTNTGTGPGAATIGDTVPATVGSVSVTCSATGAGTCNTTGSSGNTVAGSVNLPAGAIATYTVTGVVTGAGSVGNSVSVTPTTPGCTAQCGGGSTSTPTTSAVGNPFFTQTKTADQASYITGQAITYTVTVTNTGTGPGTANIGDTVPASVGSVSVTCSATGAGTCNTTGSAGNTVAGSVNLPVGEAATYTVSGTVIAAGSVTNSVSVTPTTPGCTAQCGGGSTSTPTITAAGSPVFTQTKTADKTTYIIGQTIVYTITVTNIGTGPGTANIADTVPASIGAVSVTCSSTGTGTCNTTGSAANTVVGSVNLSAGESGGYTVTGVVNSSGSVTNSVSVTPTTPGCTTQCGGGSASTQSTQAAGNPLFVQTKTADHSSYIVGQAITYTITVTNTGTGAGAATVTDAVPSTVGMVTVSCSTTGGGSCDTAGSSGNAVAGSVNLPPSAVATYVVRGIVSSVGSVGNSVTVGATTPGCTTQCGSGSTSTPMIQAVGNPVFTQTKTADKSSYLVGDPVTWTILVRNIGTGPGTANISDNVPSTVTGVTVSCSATGSASCTTTGSAGNTVSGSMSIPAADQVVYTVVGTTSANGDVTNAVTTTPTTPGCTSQCGGGTASTPETSIKPTAHETLTKKVDAAGPFTIGENVPFSVTISNHGPSAATNVKVADVPTGLTQVSATPEVGSYNPVTGIWLIPVLKPGQTFTLHLVQRITASHPVNKAVVLEPGASDPAIGNAGGLNCSAPSNGCVMVALAVASPVPSEPPLAFTGVQLLTPVIAVIGLLIGGLLLLLLAGRRREERE